MKVALLTPILAPYRIPAFRALAATPEWDVRVFVNAESEFDRSWEIDAGDLDVEHVRTLSLPRGDRTLHLTEPWTLGRALDRFAPDVVVSAEFGSRSLGAWLHCRRRRVPLVLWALPTRARLAQADPVRRVLGPFLLKRAAAVIVPGSESRRALRAWGADDRRVFVAPNCHDAEGFAKALAALDRETSLRTLRAGLGARANIALVAGRLFPVKGTSELLAAWDLLPPGLRKEWTLLFVGDGPLGQRVLQAAHMHPSGEIVRLPAVQPAELVEFYAAADLLVFPSLGDVWGLAVNEAMACGLPVVCSTRAGCAEDLIVHGETGWLADPIYPRAFALTLREALRCGTREALGRRARTRAASFTPALMAEGFRRAIRAALRRGP